MKKIIVIAVISLLVSCKNSKTTNCDAYSKTQETDSTRINLK